jgi:hypothetical protein
MSSRKILECPDTKKSATVDIEMDAAAVLSPFFDNHFLDVKNCSLWTQGNTCSRECLRSVSDLLVIDSSY